MKKYLFAILLLVSVSVVASPKREMRAAWIATVANIDWPSKEAVGNTELQKQEMIAILDTLKALHFNTVIFQVRPTADAFYPSEYEPWSSWLTGKQGVAPEPYYDPLQFVVEQAHKRCLDVHVWLNPYRATLGFTTEELDSTHIYNQHPEWFLHYGDKYYFDPSLEQTRKWLNQIVADIVFRYDIDAIHFDDYFYPYKIKGKDFPDEKQFRADPRGFTNKDDWRRDNVNLIIKELQQTIKSLRPWVEFGISPFGVWRNSTSDPQRGSATKAGAQNYDDLYADILLWLEKGWIDYVMPQLYWEIGKKVADFDVLIRWWKQYSYNRNLYIGVFDSQLGKGKAESAWNKGNEICRQISLERSLTGIDGISHYSTVAIMDNRMGLRDSLRNDYYKDYALVPINRNIKSQGIQKPNHVKIKGKQLQWHFTPNARYYVVYAFDINSQYYDTNKAEHILCMTTDNYVDLTKYKLPDKVVLYVSAVNRYHVESEPSHPVYSQSPLKYWLQNYTESDTLKFFTLHQ
ncbi:MAG: family 10 glycosylhydrolase [Paludibacteraceae bacterium]|nr:family 10 glycosylhydrolase [Paludibacteraceae bacterium]